MVNARTVLLALAFITTIASQLLIFVVILSTGDEIIPGKTLYVTAHPDDEVIFFGPSILRSETAYILCISRGAPNGTLRTMEFMESCKVLNLDGRCFIDEELALPDGFEFSWEREDIRNIVHKYVEKIQPNRIVTFDKAGVSGHPNHVAVSNALLRTTEEDDHPDYYVFNASLRRKVVQERAQHAALDTVPVYGLRTDPVLIKYMGFYGTILYVMSNSIDSGYFLVVPPKEVLTMTLEKAFLKHESQVVWYRVLYMLWSRFLFFNHLIPLRA